MPDKNNILLKLREMKDNLTPVERKIADYILENTSQIPRLSIKMLATKSKTSDASVIRFCKSMGCDGYRDLVVSISGSLGSADEAQAEQYTDILPGNDINTIINNISMNNCKSIQDTLSVINRDEIAKAVELLRKTQKIDFYGVGASGLVCMDAQQKFMRINKMCHAYTDGHSQLTASVLLESSDVVVIISNSGSTNEILEALEIAKDSGAPVIAITRYNKSELAKKADVVLFISTPEITMRSGAMGSRIAMLNVIDILFAGVASAEYSNVKKYLSKTHNILNSKHRK
ncbi:MurR/RpiR family transcriptional regulator [Clostridium estertheticum]|uniref:MurR/RpiR family transcriptional regulator n=1 Tax=Clostridium estertheticum TaxID=238834 RepID=UPI0013E90FD7|nr:MurR/RpiR family transcriptional regulator [Clostridium estertheticum]MBZ9687067.1 MurR/RpiR family transcriptional regulator [Clostridium estertheticum]